MLMRFVPLRIERDGSLGNRPRIVQNSKKFIDFISQD